MIKEKIFIVFISLAFVVTTALSASAESFIVDWAFNVDGSISYWDDPNPVGLDDSGFDWDFGLGTLTMTMSSGSYFGAFFDHEIVEPGNTFFNEYGAANGVPASGQTWEIDEPSYVYGDIRTYEEWDDIQGEWVEFIGNVEQGTLDNLNGVPNGSEDDVSMALAWDFSLDVDETALITLNICSSLDVDCSVPGGFYLSHSDDDSGETLYFSGDLSITSAAAPVPEPSTFFLLGIGLVGLLGFRRKNV